MSLLQTEVVPQVAALTANVGKITSQLHALEEVLIVLLETKEEQARQEWAARKERELNEQKNRFLSVRMDEEHTASNADSRKSGRS